MIDLIALRHRFWSSSFRRLPACRPAGLPACRPFAGLPLVCRRPAAPFHLLQHWLLTWPFGSTWTFLGASRALLGGSWAPLGLNLGALGANLGATWAASGPSWALLGPTWAHFGLHGPSKASLGLLLEALGRVLEAPRSCLGGPKRSQQLNSEAKSPPRSQFWRPRALSDAKLATRCLP